MDTAYTTAAHFGKEACESLIVAPGLEFSPRRASF
jgi:hypothetical protein